VTAIRAIRRFAGVRPLAVLGWVLLGGVGLEVVMGAGLALLDQPELLKVIHVALATALWSAGVLACAFSGPTWQALVDSVTREEASMYLDYNATWMMAEEDLAEAAAAIIQVAQ